MNIIKGAAAAAAAAITLSAVPFAASAQTSAPIQITSCDVQQYVPTQVRPFWYPWGGPFPYGSLYTDGLHISYVNRTQKTIDRVAFAVDYRGDVQRIVDAGTFSPGVTIDHEFGQFTGLAFLGNQPNSCSVAGVRFTDGSVWHAQPMPRG
jgi:hypothetical protein